MVTFQGLHHQSAGVLTSDGQKTERGGGQVRMSKEMEQGQEQKQEQGRRGKDNE